jgi:phage shock protein A
MPEFSAEDSLAVLRELAGCRRGYRLQREALSRYQTQQRELEQELAQQTATTRRIEVELAEACEEIASDEGSFREALTAVKLVANERDAALTELASLKQLARNVLTESQYGIPSSTPYDRLRQAL